MKKIIAICLLLVCHSAFAQITTIYQENFTGSDANPLNGTTTDVGGGVWSAGAGWTEAGKFTVGTNNQQNAFLPFAPQANMIYNLTLNMATVNYPGSTAWSGFGFSTANNINLPFYNSGASFWGILRGNGQLDFFANGNTFTANVTPQSVVPLVITLDTRSALWNYNVTYSGNTLASGALTTNPTINYVGFGQNGVDSRVSSFILTSQVPEPSTYLLIGVTAVLFGVMLRRKLVAA